MQWTDEGIVLGVRRHGEGNAILEVMTQAHGRHLGLVRGGAGARMRPVLQPGNVVGVTWRARLDEHLGLYAVEGLHLRAASLLDASHAVFGVTHLAALCRLLPERDPHCPLRPVSTLDLESCAATGTAVDLRYVSPKSGRAVSGDAGAPWHDRLLRLPAFLLDRQAAGEPTRGELADGFVLTGFFLGRYVLEPRGLGVPEARDHFIAAALRVPPQPIAPH